jgi:hypothetical protein
LIGVKHFPWYTSFANGRAMNALFTRTEFEDSVVITAHRV